MLVINSVEDCHYFLPGQRLPSQLLSTTGRYQFILLGEQRHACILDKLEQMRDAHHRFNIINHVIRVTVRAQHKSGMADYDVHKRTLIHTTHINASAI